MKSLQAFKLENDDFQVEYEILSPIDTDSIIDADKQEILLAIQDVDKQISICEDEIAKLNADIDRLTNHADGLDYTIAVASGILTGLIDSLFVGDFNPSIEEIVTDYARKKSGKNISNYEEAQEFLEKRYHTKHDGAYCSGYDIKGNKHHVNGHTHRMDDFTHHPTLMGLVMSILVRYIRYNVLFNKEGEAHLVKVKTDIKDVISAWGPAVLSGIMIWIANMAENYAEELDMEISEPIRKLIKIVAATPVIIDLLKCADSWYSHIVSDVSTPKGISGILLSFLKEISALPILNKTGLAEELQILYNDKKMNFASDLEKIEKLKKQAVPVIANELIVRTFYFIRRLVEEIKMKQALKMVDWKKIIPFGNRTVERMMTIATGTFTAVDLTDAAIRGAIGSGGNWVGFAKEFILHVNFVGIGRFAIAVGTEVGMGIKRGKLVDERIKVMGQELTLLNTKVYYTFGMLYCTEADMLEAEQVMWIAEQDTGKTLSVIYENTQEAVDIFKKELLVVSESLKKISSYRDGIEEHNPGLIKNIVNILKY